MNTAEHYSDAMESPPNNRLQRTVRVSGPPLNRSVRQT